MSIQKLIDQTFSYSVEAKGTDLEQLYLDDMKSFQKAQFLMARKDFDHCSTYIDEMILNHVSRSYLQLLRNSVISF